jgi:FtsP/CotA-like multicopper oxidase with cupredoxin domain
MRTPTLLLAVGLAVSSYLAPARQTLPAAHPNPNITPAGKLRSGVLRLDLEARLAMWYPDGDSLPGIAVEAFGERGKRPETPGPFIRVPAGTEIRASVRNALQHDTLTLYFPAAESSDSLIVPPGGRRELRTQVTRPGTFSYYATISTPLARKLGVGGMLAGAVVVDSVDAKPSRDRIFLLLSTSDSADPALGFPIPERSVRSINGRSWPHTERLALSVGDTVHWRLVSVGNDVHPMHLHGFYFRVDAIHRPRGREAGTETPGRWVVTERMSAFSTMSITWVPERAGNWLFHCHFQRHVAPHGPLNVVGPNGERQRIAVPVVTAASGDAHANHAASGMAGLAIGIEVRPRAGVAAPEPAAVRRHLRLVATMDSRFPDSVPAMRYALDEPGSAEPPAIRAAISPTIRLTRDEPVAITIVNRLREPTAIHWHGIELESYFDGVAGFSGAAPRLTPIILPGDSFEAQFTPPRSGTFIYHSHADEIRQHRAGLVGALIVEDSAAGPRPDDLVFVIKSAREKSGPTDSSPLEINGTIDPDTVLLRAGHRYRLRFIGMQVRFPNATLSLTARPDSSYANVPDSLVVDWRPVAKDGSTIPRGSQKPRRAQQIVSMGETYDFEFVPAWKGDLRLEVRNAGPEGRLLARAPFRVE